MASAICEELTVRRTIRSKRFARSNFNGSTFFSCLLYTSGFEVGSTGLYAEARSEYNTWGENGAFMHNAACPYEALQIATDLTTMGTKDGSIQPFVFISEYFNISLAPAIRL